MRNLLVFIVFIFAILPNARGQELPEQQVFRMIYNQEYPDAEHLLKSMHDSIDPMYYAVLDIDLSYWKNVTGTDEPDYAAFEQTLETYTLSHTGNVEEKEVQLITLSYRLRYQLKRYQLFRAITTRKKTVDLFNEFKTRDNNFSNEQLQLFRLYDALILYFDNYLKPFFVSGKHDAMQEAIQEMERLTRSNQMIIRTLSAYFLGKIYLNYENQPKEGVAYFQWLSEEYPENKKFRELLLEAAENSKD